MRRWVWGILALVVIAAGVGGYVVYRHHEDSISLTSTDATACKAANTEARGMTGPFRFGAKRVDILGDSYAVGTTLSDPSHQAYSVLLAQREHWDLTIRGIGRTGFVNGGYCGNQSYPTRIAQVLADKPQLIVVEGGLNDAGQPGIGAAARKLLAQIPTDLPVVVIGPTDAPGRSGPDKRTIDRELAAAAGARYISPLAWKLRFGPDGIHMTAAGARTLAEHLVRALAAFPAATGQ